MPLTIMLLLEGLCTSVGLVSCCLSGTFIVFALLVVIWIDGNGVELIMTEENYCSI